MITPDIRVASYNVRKCVGTDRRRDPGRILRVIAGLGADIVAIQEADRRLGQRPGTLEPERIEGETGLRSIPVAVNDVSLGWHGNAVLVAPGVDVTTIERVRLPGIEPRGALMVDAEKDGRPFRFIAAHLGLRRGCRRQQLGTLAGRLGNDGPPSIIAGDFNEWRPRLGLEALAHEFEVHAPGMSYHARWPVAPLDRIAVGRGMALSDAGVAETALARVASDHLPIWADLSFVEGDRAFASDGPHAEAVSTLPLG